MPNHSGFRSARADCRPAEPLGGSTGRCGSEERILLATATCHAGVAALTEKICAAVQELGVPHVEHRDGAAIINAFPFSPMSEGTWSRGGARNEAS